MSRRIDPRPARSYPAEPVVTGSSQHTSRKFGVSRGQRDPPENGSVTNDAALDARLDPRLAQDAPARVPEADAIARAALPGARAEPRPAPAAAREPDDLQRHRATGHAHR